MPVEPGIQHTDAPTLPRADVSSYPPAIMAISNPTSVSPFRSFSRSQSPTSTTARHPVATLLMNLLQAFAHCLIAIGTTRTLPWLRSLPTLLLLLVSRLSLAFASLFKTRATNDVSVTEAQLPPRPLDVVPSRIRSRQHVKAESQEQKEATKDELEMMLKEAERKQKKEKRRRYRRNRAVNRREKEVEKKGQKKWEGKEKKNTRIDAAQDINPNCGRNAPSDEANAWEPANQSVQDEEVDASEVIQNAISEQLPKNIEGMSQDDTENSYAIKDQIVDHSLVQGEEAGEEVSEERDAQVLPSTFEDQKDTDDLLGVEWHTANKSAAQPQPLGISEEQLFHAPLSPPADQALNTDDTTPNISQVDSPNTSPPRTQNATLELPDYVNVNENQRRVFEETAVYRLLQEISAQQLHLRREREASGLRQEVIGEVAPTSEDQTEVSGDATVLLSLSKLPPPPKEHEAAPEGSEEIVSSSPESPEPLAEENEEQAFPHEETLKPLPEESEEHPSPPSGTPEPVSGEFVKDSMALLESPERTPAENKEEVLSLFGPQECAPAENVEDAIQSSDPPSALAPVQGEAEHTPGEDYDNVLLRLPAAVSLTKTHAEDFPSSLKSAQDSLWEESVKEKASSSCSSQSSSPGLPERLSADEIDSCITSSVAHSPSAFPTPATTTTTPASTNPATPSDPPGPFNPLLPIVPRTPQTPETSKWQCGFSWADDVEAAEEEAQQQLQKQQQQENEEERQHRLVEERIRRLFLAEFPFGAKRSGRGMFRAGEMPGIFEGEEAE